MSLAADTIAYQSYLEGVRAHPDDEELAEDLDRARRAMEITWLEALDPCSKPVQIERAHAGAGRRIPWEPIGTTTDIDGGNW